MKSFRVAFFLGVKSILKGNAGVTLLTVVMLMLANLNLMFVSGLMDGIVQSANNRLINTYSGNIIIEAAGDNRYIRNVRELVSRIEGVEGVTAVAYRNSLGAELTYEEEERTNGTIKGVAPEREREVFQIAGSLLEGSYLEGRELDQIVLGVQLAGADQRGLELYASSLKRVHAGDKVSVAYTNGVKKQYRVKGIFYSEFLQADLQAFVTEREFNSVNPVSANQATTIHLKLRDDSESPRIIQEVARLRDGLQFKTWQDTAGIVQSMTQSFAIIHGILSVVNMLVAGITVFIVTYIDLVQKRRQIGIERAIGITSGTITLSYLFRALFYALLAVIISLLLYIYTVVPLEARYPFHFPFGDVMLFSSQGQLARAGLTILVVAVIGALVPVQQSLRLRILDAIWG
ncbi:MAG: ABC transporter permease [Chloroflexota bacterium]